MKYRIAALVCFASLFLVALFAGIAPAASAAGSEAGFSMFWAILSIFVGGMALDLTPCIYPLLPITISYFSGKSLASKTGRGFILINAALYILGLAIINSLLGVFAALSGHLLGALLENPLTFVLVALVMVLFALSMFGVWEFRLPASITGVASRNYTGYIGSLFMGATLGIVAAPCIGPFVAGVLVMVANSGDPVFGFWVFFSLSLGMGFPLFLLALLSGRLTMLPKSGEWMLWVREIMGWVLIGAAAYFLLPIIPHMLGIGLLSATAVAAGIHLGWIDRTEAGSAAFRWIRKGVGVVCIGLAATVIWYSMPSKGIEWTPYSQTALAEAEKSGRPVILDFYADWCPSCRHMDSITFHNPSVVKASKNFVMIRVDLTHRGDAAKEELLRTYGIRGIPTVIFLKPGGAERTDLRVMELTGPRSFLTRMTDLRDGAHSAGVQYSGVHSVPEKGRSLPKVLREPSTSITAPDLAMGSS